MVNVGYDLLHARQSIELAEKYPFIYASVGLHPHDAKEADNVFWQEIYKLARHPKVVAIGEIGLDYYYDHSPRDVQREVFRRQIQVAKDLQLPIIIHNRDAHQDTLKLCGRKKPLCRGCFPCLFRKLGNGREVIDLGFYISVVPSPSKTQEK